MLQQYGGHQDYNLDKRQRGEAYPVETYDGTRRPVKHLLRFPGSRARFFFPSGGAPGDQTSNRPHAAVVAAAAVTITALKPPAASHLQSPKLREKAPPQRDLEALGEVPGHEGQELEEEGLRQPARRPVRLQQVPSNAKSSKVCIEKKTPIKI